MKKFLIFILLIMLNTPLSFADTFNGEVSFDWISKTQMERDKNIFEIKRNIFSYDIVKNYGRMYFKQAYKEKLKDKDYIQNYNDVNQGKKEDLTRNFCGFYWKKYLIAYGIQYKNNPSKNFYYDALGNLKWIDMYSDEYPDFPYKTYQYGMNGKLKAVYYFINNYDQYVYDANGKFQGRWYKDKMYDRNAKVIMIRSDWE